MWIPGNGHLAGDHGYCFNHMSESTRLSQGWSLIWSFQHRGHTDPLPISHIIKIIHLQQHIGWGQPKCSSMDQWMNKMWPLHATKYHSALKRVKFWHMLQPGWIWKKFGRVKHVRHRRVSTVQFHWYKVPRTARFTETQSRMVAARG